MCIYTPLKIFLYIHKCIYIYTFINTASKKKKAYPPGINPITKQPYAKKNKSGYVSKGAIHIDNIIPKKQKTKAAPKKTMKEMNDEIAAMLAEGWSGY